MRQITIDFEKMSISGLIDNKYAGYLGEHNATELFVVKPADLIGVQYSLAFMTNGEIVHSKYFSDNEPIKVSMWQQITQDSTVYVQLEAYDENGDYLGKSSVARLSLGNSVHGVDVIADSDNPDVYAEIALNSWFRETLEDNADTLDKLSTSEDGKLLFDGKEINAGESKPITAADVFYENKALIDQTKTVKGALDEAILFVTEGISETYLEKSELGNAIEDALREAKNSGEFDGADGKDGKDGVDGKDGNDYVLTDADKAEIAGMVNPKLHILEAVVDYATTGIHTYDPMSLTVEADIPTNARAKRVEIPDVVNETDEFIALEDMVSKDPSYGFNAPYFIMYPKNKTGVMSKVAANVVFAFQTANSFYEAAANYAYDGKAIKIYYEIEE